MGRKDFLLTQNRCLNKQLKAMKNTQMEQDIVSAPQKTIC